jgi:hypothetical protein
MTAYGDKLRSLGFLSKKGTSERRVVRDERDGSIAGVETRHWDGSQDAAARPKPIRVKAQLIQEER